MRITARRILISATLLLLPPAADACRLWAVVGGGYPQEMIDEQMRSGTSANLKGLSSSHPDGWGFTWNPPASIVRRGGSPANDPWTGAFDSAVDEMIATRPSVAVAHIRHCSAGADTCRCGIPDPHPFQRDGLVFAHNGSIPIATLVALLNEDDPAYLDHHPPDYVGDYIDSELYFLYLLKAMRQHPEMTRVEALRQAIFRLTGVTNSRLNFVLVSGDTLFALRYVPLIEGDPVRYYPANTPAPSFWVAASQALGSHPADWGTIPPKSLAVLVPGQDAVFYPVGGVLDSPAAGPQNGVAQARPNPAGAGRPVAIPVIAPPGGGEVAVRLMDAQGRLVWKVTRWLPAGSAVLDWDGRDLDGRAAPSGSYFCRITAGAQTRTQRVTIVR